MSDSFSIPQAFVEIYPFEGGPYFITGGQLLSVLTKSSVKEGGGQFEIVLAPGGPNGTSGGPTWSEVLTPLSFVLIGMQRWQHSQIVMAGVVVTATETQDWSSDRGVQRVTTLAGLDFSYFFTTFSYYTLSFSGLTAGNVVAAALGRTQGPAFPQMLSAGFISGTPDQIGQNFYTTAMAGPGQGILTKTYVPYPASASGQLTFWDATSTFFEAYPAAVVFDMSYIVTESTWLEKFRSIFPSPFYEVFVTTAPLAAYGARAGQRAGYPFTMQSLVDAEPVAPVLVCRVNPTPMIPVTVSGPRQGGAFGDLDTARWEGLTLFDAVDQSASGGATGNGHGLIEQTFTFSAETTHNYYAVNSSALLQFMNESTNTAPFIMNYMGAGDPASIARYGWRPLMISSSWYMLQSGTSSAQNIDFPQSIASLVARMTSTYEPEPLMLRGEGILQLRPDILPGNRFTCRPFKWEADWDFYIDSVEHDFKFGGPSVTRLTLSRGLPSAVYMDSSQGGVLYNAHIGNAMRQNGNYVVGLPDGSPPGLMTFGAASEVQAFMAALGPPWNNPQTM